ncbi:hypothetical protein ACJRO7_022374 [Eucalyptus globulus]|uniref:EF-hand domain-containing protein n=1 Tax=Eucalyptus globulus TaxID=34317 RepID=A0ABD3JY74_EUCGL
MMISPPLPDGTRPMNLEEFKNFLKKFDGNKDNRISKEELQDIIRSNGKWFSGWKSKRALSHADANRDGFIDDKEMINLVEFAKKQLNLTVVAN